MSVVIAYQSLNSNVSHEHDVESSTSQFHTRKARKTLKAKSPHKISLRYPTLEDKKYIDVAVHGPAELLPTTDLMDDGEKKGTKRKRDEMEKDSEKDTMLSMFYGKAQQIYQFAQREFGQPCNLLAFGELDSKHKSWGDVEASLGKAVHVSVFSKACNCFSLHSANSVHTTKYIAEGDGWVAAECNGVLVVFVHVPNSLATSPSKAITFYSQIKTKVLHAGGGVIDLVMGDTNQPSALFSPTNISKGFDGTFSDGHSSSKGISPVDTHSVIFKGTNSVETKKFDVAIYNTATVKGIEVKYFSQFSHLLRSATAYTDHMGVLVKVDK